ncbi:hypothetical protein M409DRAFT_15932 [Zasmidium cellare ATCC 36951]|uniref:Heterokaryon incompatibility domain-containing protein n=1 Tax=Zasmidium cellare ATCC 36951 TaxID=1080233 RepID=A0A6A6D2L5_ZASCE|nr:uncharacterized protein M409DRAFT_15932 [Zasmidium cellare ATCC 36951]KAF2173654.1 hypothetical protein M409DRAFT_15932 [Zasmidium cellare ATCC 36951]
MASSPAANRSPWSLSISPSDWRLGKYLVNAVDPGTFTDPPIHKLETGQIRVLELHPGARGDELKCSVRVCTLDSTAIDTIAAGNKTFHPFSYEAVSYVWGSTERNHVLKCNKIVNVQGEMDSEERLFEMYQEQFETEIAITENLKEMLLALRDTRDTRSLWVDGVCIKKTTKSGPSSYKARSAFRVARKLASLYNDEAAWRTALSCRDQAEEWQIYGFHVWRLVKDNALFLDQQEHRALRDGLLGKEWFIRTWVYQELALARNVVLRYADEEMDWDTLDTAVQAFVELSLPLSPLNNGHKAVRDMGRKRLAVAMVRDYNLKHLRGDPGGHPLSAKMRADELLLESLLVDVRSLRAKDPHDKVFGILGLLLPIEGQSISVDYTVPVHELYMQVLCFLGGFCAATAREPEFKFLSDPNGANASEEENQPEGQEPHSLLRIAGIKALTIAETFEVEDFERQAELLTGMPANYPLTNDTYVDVYLNIFDARDPIDFLLGTRRDMHRNFWHDHIPGVLADANGESQIVETSESSPTSPPVTADILKSLFRRTRLQGIVLGPQTRQAERPIRDKNWRVGFVSTNGFMGVVPKKSRAGD